MKLLADENIDSPIVKYLRAAGHDVKWMAESGAGMSDGEIISLAMTESRVILTFDRDYGELVFHSGKSAFGVILLRLEGQSGQSMLESFQLVWPKVEGIATGHFVVATNTKIRVRPLFKL